MVRSGIYSNHILVQIMTEWLKKKGIETFGDLPEGKLSILASNISNGKIVVFPNDLPHYGLSAATFPIAAAVRMSTTLLFFFSLICGKQQLIRSPIICLMAACLVIIPSGCLMCREFPGGQLLVSVCRRNEPMRSPRTLTARYLCSKLQYKHKFREKENTAAISLLPGESQPHGKTTLYH